MPRARPIWRLLRNVPVLRRGGAVLASVLAGFLAGAAAPAPGLAAELFLTGEREIYLAIDKLDAMGMLPGFLANRRPYSVAAVQAALDGNPGATGGSGFDADLARWVSLAIEDPLLVQGTIGAWASEARETLDNQGGIPTPKGVSTRLSVLARETTNPHVSGQASGSWFYGKGGDYGTRIGETSLEVGLPYASLQIGKLTTWYGPGRRGALLFTNNAQSYPGIRLHNPVPIPVPGRFSFLGNVQYDLFFARLAGSDRPINDSILSGIRLAARPNRYFEIGASRAIQYGGNGQDDDLSTYWKLLTGGGGSEGETLGSLDASLRLPFPGQPVELYGEWGGEDQSRLFVYAHHGWLTGIFLPSIGTFRNADLRVEYATTRTSVPDAWYQDPDYPHEYRDRILGHPMGSNATDLFFQGHYFFQPTQYLEVTLTRTDRYYTDGQPKERTGRAAVGLVSWLTGKVRLEGEVGWEKVKNSDGIAGSDSNDLSFRLAFSYQLEHDAW
jgi:hypothetical protein